MTLNVIILAGGSGTRMASNLPKVLHQIGGKTLLDHVIHAVMPLRPKKIFVVYGHMGAVVLDAMKHHDGKLIWVEQTTRLGTGHAVQQVLPHLKNENDKVLILCGDVPLISTETLKHLVETTGDDQLGIMTANVPHPYGLGRILRDEFGQMKSIIEEKDASEHQKRITEINTGIYCVPAKFLHQWLPKLSAKNAQKEYYLTDIVSFAGKDHINVNVTHPRQIEEIYGTNTRAELAKLERIYQHWQAIKLMDAGVSLLDPNRLDIRGEVIPAKDCIIDVNVILEGKVELSEGCIIDANSHLKNVKLGPNVHVKANCVIEGADIGTDCQIGPFARIRPETKLHKNVHIGNFVEIKNTEINNNSKANHLSYLGDAHIGKNVNIGAGVITCNYDGAHKHKTTIEDDVFVGSDVQIIAPVTIEKGATIGAGTTVSQKAPAGKLTVGRTKQQTIDGWQRPKK